MKEKTVKVTQDFLLLKAIIREVGVTVDNRDDGCTWLWINDEVYIEVNPIELFLNMLENNHPELHDLYQEMIAVDLDKANALRDELDEIVERDNHD